MLPLLPLKEKGKRRQQALKEEGNVKMRKRL